jgi:hypothetical protein
MLNEKPELQKQAQQTFKLEQFDVKKNMNKNVSKSIRL